MPWFGSSLPPLRLVTAPSARISATPPLGTMPSSNARRHHRFLHPEPHHDAGECEQRRQIHESVRLRRWDRCDDGRSRGAVVRCGDFHFGCARWRQMRGRRSCTGVRRIPRRTPVIVRFGRASVTCTFVAVSGPAFATARVVRTTPVACVAVRQDVRNGTARENGRASVRLRDVTPAGRRLLTVTANVSSRVPPTEIVPLLSVMRHSLPALLFGEQVHPPSLAPALNVVVRLCLRPCRSFRSWRP